MADAMIRSRAAIIDLSKTVPSRNLAQRRSGQHDHAFRWDPWVRAFLMAQDTTGGMVFSTRSRSIRGAKVSSAILQVPGAGGRKVQLLSVTAPPPSVFAAQMRQVLEWAELREERQGEILAQVGNCLPFWGAIVPLASDRMGKTRELIDAAMQMTMLVEMRFKHELACWRPADFSPQIQPMIRTPGHGTLPSGHCTEAFVVVEVLKCLLNAYGDRPAQREARIQLERLAARIAVNRVIAGVHFPIDNIVGRLMGVVLGRYFLRLCGYAPRDPAAGPARGVFDGTKCPAELRFDPSIQPLHAPSSGCTFVPTAIPTVRAGGSVLAEVFERARMECADLGVTIR